MFRCILVPLDRSAFAERALPLALALARRAGARLHLAGVHRLYELDDPHACWGPYLPGRDADRRREEREYLDATARRLSAAPGAAVTAGGPRGSTALAEMAAESLLEQAGEVGADLIVAATHGLGPGAGPASRGVARALVRQGGVPVLLVKPGAAAAGPAVPDPLPSEVLLPLDGSGLAEQAIGPALGLARLSGARCTLLRVVGCRLRSGPPAEAAEAESYLERVAGGLRRAGLDLVTRVVCAPDAAEAIVGASGGRAEVLVAMTTHGRSGLGRLLMGSGAERVSLGTASPVLLYRPTGGTGP